MKRTLQALLLALVAIMMPIGAWAEDFESGGIYYNITSAEDKTVEVTYRGSSYTQYKEYSNEVTIPASVTYNGITYSVTSIGSLAFYDCGNLRSISIPNSVTSIGSNAFYLCDKLSSIIIPGTVTSIGSAAFFDCSSLSSVTLSEGLTSIGDDAFKDCSSLSSISIPGTVTSIGSSAFRGSSLSSVTLCEGLTSIGNYAFYGSSSLSSVTLPESLTSIGDRAFYNCSSLDSISIPGKVTSIGDRAFYGCSKLSSVTLPYSLTSIGEYMFDGCSKLDSISIPGKVASIGSYAFQNCTSLSSVTLPESLTSIGDWAFSGCSSLSSISIPGKVNSVGTRAFQNCSSLSNVTLSEGLTSIGEYMFSGCSSLDSISIPGTVTTIGSYAFQGSSLSNATLCEGLTLIGNYAFYGSSSLSSVTLPESLTSIGDWAFSGCSSLSSISIPGKVTSIGRYAFQGSSLSSVTLCEGLTSIGNYAFSKCYSLTGITIPSTVTSISSYAFSGCAFYEEEFFNNSNCKDENNWGAEIIPHGEEIDGMIIKDHVLIYVRRYLASVKIPESVTSIGVEAFKDCILLDSVSIPNSVTSIGDDAFYNCSSLSSVSLPDSLTSIGDLAFSGCSSLDSISIPGKVTSIGDYAFYNCSSLSSVNLPESLTSIGDWAFSGCSSLSSVDIPNSVTSIGDDAFYNCSKLSSVTLPDSLTSIGDYAFSGCSSLSSMSLPESLTSIGDYAFSGCSSLDSVSIPNSVTSIGNYAFYGCNSLSSVTLSEGLTSIGSYAFYNCSSLGSISIPGKVTSIGDRAFYGCSKLSSVTLPDSLTSIGSYAFYYCSSLKDVHYFGTAEQWSAITIGSSNEPLTEATIHYYENGICTTCGNEYQFATLNAEGYYEISNAGQLFWFAQQVNIGGKTTANALLTADIDLENRVWYPIGLNGEKAQENGENVLAHYDGIFDGNGHTVSNFTVTGNRNSALVGYATDKAIVKKVGVINATTEGQSAAAVLAWGGTVENCYAINCTSTATFFSGGSVCSNSVNSVINSFAVGCVVNADPITSIEPELSPVGGGANATNCYYQNVTTNEELTLSNGQIEVTQEQLASGEVACLLGEAWGQNVDGEGEKDAYPVLGGAKLYRGYNTCAEDAQMVYTNNAGVSAEKPEHSHEDGFCTECGHIDAEGGVTIRDGAYEAFAIAEDMEVNSLTYVRTLPNEDWNSLFVPFEIEVTETFLQNYDVAYFNNMHAYDKDGNGAIDAMDMEVILIKEGTLHANHPYFIRAKSEEAKDINIELGATTLYGTAEENRTCITASSAYMNFQLVGIYEQMVGSEGVYVITTDGTWSPIAEEARLNPFRLFLKMSERSGSPVKVDEQALSHVRIRVAGEGTETGIGELEADGAEVKAEVYDLSGRRVAHPQKGGIYIMAGKKVVL